MIIFCQFSRLNNFKPLETVSLDITEDFRNICVDLMMEFTPDQEKLLRFECRNTQCFFATTDSTKLFRHEQSCRTSTLIQCKQVSLAKPNSLIRKSLVNEGILPDLDWHNWHFCTFDVECFMEKTTDDQGYPKLVHRLVSIAIKSSFGTDEESNIYIERRSMDPFDLKIMMQKLLGELTYLSGDMLNYIPDSVIQGHKKYLKQTQDKEFKKLPVEQQNKVRAKFRYLDDCLKLRIYSWNGERYDNNVVWAPLMDILQYDRDAFRKISIIRRGSGIMQFTYGAFCFRDFINYTNPMSLEKFAQSQGLSVTNMEKTTFPYELYSEISEIKNATEFPGYTSFESSLTRDTENFPQELIKLCNKELESGKWKTADDIQKYFQFSSDLEIIIENGKIKELRAKNGKALSNLLNSCPLKYFKSKTIFDNECATMSDYLRSYNLNDCILLTECIKTYAAGYFDTWKVNIHEKMSLPGIAQGILQFLKVTF